MSSIIFTLPDLFASYKKWVSKNPLLASDYETAAKWVSYFVAGRVNDSHILSELIYSLSNLLVLFNDRVITAALKLELPNSGDRLRLWLTIIEYSEVFMELSAKKVWGNSGRWLVIIAIQVFKCLSRLLLVYHHKESIIQHPPISVLQRKEMEKNIRENGAAELAQAQLDDISFPLMRSGKVIRKINATQLGNRTWKPIESTNLDNSMQTIEQALAGQQLIAETVYIFKPLVHLGSMACFGKHTWKPWALSLLLDLGSLHLYANGKNMKNSLTNKQKLQISRRYVALLLYLLRSPFYERHSKGRIEALLIAISNSVPLAALICTPLRKYLPFWQSNYFYMWST